MMTPSDLQIPMQLDNSATISKPDKCVYVNVSNYWLDSEAVQPEKKIRLTGNANFVKNCMKISFYFGCL